MHNGLSTYANRLLTKVQATTLFEGNRVLVHAFDQSILDPLLSFLSYLSSRDTLFPSLSPLWLTSLGDVPTRSFFMSYFHILFSKSFGGASMQAGGATYLVQLGTSSQIIWGTGRWSSDAWELYI